MDRLTMRRRRHVRPALWKTILVAAMTGVLLPGAVHGESEEPVWHYKKEMLRALVDAVPGILDTQSTNTGRWGSGIWIISDQHPIYSLAAAWGTQSPDNPYYHDPRVLEAIMDGGDALADDLDENGQWMFRKKDGSTWGKIYMPWTYSRWIRTYSIIRDAMPSERRAKWHKALLLGYTGIADNELTTKVHNIPAHHAMGLYFAAEVFERPDWAEKATNYLRRTAAAQTPEGYWSENFGPVVGYNLVYVDALGVYYAVSKDKQVLPALERAARFHANFSYPDGSQVETIDERQRYSGSVGVPNVGFTFSPLGRGYLRRQWELVKNRPKPVSAEAAASYLLYGEEGPSRNVCELGKPQHYVTGDGLALVHGEGDWFTCLSAYCCPVPTSRWIQDRHNLVSLFNAKAGGLIVGGGNTKLTPLLSTFTVGDVGLLVNRREENPDFVPPPGLWHVPSEGRLDAKELAMHLKYGDATLCVRADLSDTKVARLIYSQLIPTTAPAEAHVPLWAQMNKQWRTASGREGKISPKAKAWKLTASETGRWFEHAGWRMSVPAGATIQWPVAWHNQYAKYGELSPGTGQIVMTLPFGEKISEYVVEFREGED